MSDELHEWLQRIGNRHGFLVAGEGAAQGEDAGLQQMREQNARLMEQLEERRRRAQERVAELRAQGFDAQVVENPDGSIVITGERDRLPASSRPDSEVAELEAEATHLAERASAAVDGLMTGVSRSEDVDFQNRLNGIETRRNGAGGDAQELRRVIGDLRELIEDAGARSRETDRGTSEMIGSLAAGTAGPEVSGRQRAADSTEQASADQNADFDALDEEARRLFRRAQGILADLESRLEASEMRELAARLNTFAGRLRDPALRGDAQEARRVTTDLYATVQDFERRARELERSPASAHRGQDDGTDGNPRQNPSARADADFASLDRECHDMHDRASALYDSLASRLDQAEHRDLRNRINAFAGELRDPANRENAQERRRMITDLRSMIADMQSRERELGGSP